MTLAAETITKPAPPRKKRTPKDIPGITRPMTYEEYLASPEEMRRYDILDGWKVYRTYGAKKLANPTRTHQRAQGRLYLAFWAFEQAQQSGQVIQPPCDVLVRRNPTRSRQPDMLFISTARLRENPPSDDPAPLDPAPELVVEILSASDTRRVQSEKIADYAGAGVLECWLVSTEAETIEVLRLRENTEAETVAVYGHGQTVASQVFPDLTIPLAAIFAE